VLGRCLKEQPAREATAGKAILLVITAFTVIAVALIDRLQTDEGARLVWHCSGISTLCCF
jgi:hypothetical protein